MPRSTKAKKGRCWRPRWLLLVCSLLVWVGGSRGRGGGPAQHVNPRPDGRIFKMLQNQTWNSKNAPTPNPENKLCSRPLWTPLPTPGGGGVRS